MEKLTDFTFVGTRTISINAQQGSFQPGGLSDDASPFNHVNDASRSANATRDCKVCSVADGRVGHVFLGR